MTSYETPGFEGDIDLEAPEVEGDGYFQDKTLQWVDLCPHMGNPEKSLLRTLTNLTTKRSRSRRIRPDELRQMVYTAPVKVGEEPKLISHSGLLRLLRNLASIGQITDRDGDMLRFSSRESARSRPITMTVWRYPRHECGSQRNVFDALGVIRGEDPKWKPAGTDNPALLRPTQAGQEVDPGRKAGHEVNPAGHEVNPAGHEVNPAGHEVNPHPQGDQQKPWSPSSPPSSPPSSSSSSHPGGTSPTPTPRGPADDEDELPKERRTDAPSASVALVQEMTEASVEEAQAVITRLQKEQKRVTGEEIRVMRRYIAAFDPEDLTPHLDAVRAQRVPQGRTEAPQAPRRATCSLHHIQTPCTGCRSELLSGAEDARPVIDMYLALGAEAASLRPDLAGHPVIVDALATA